MSESTQQRIEHIQRRYNPENDLGPGPDVTWADRELLAIIEQQQAEIAGLQAQIDSLRSFVSHRLAAVAAGSERMEAVT